MKHRSERSGSGESSILPTHRRHQSTEVHTEKRSFFSKVKDCIKQFGVDLVVVLLLGIIAMLIDKYVPDVGGRARYFRYLQNEDGTPSTSPQMEAFSHPYRKQIITFWVSAGLDIGVPAFFIFVLELSTKGSIVNWVRGSLGALNSIIMCCFVQIIIKTLSGGFRPSWFEICKPVPKGPGYGSDGSWYKWDICTGDQKKIGWAMESFPSGHVATSFAAGVFLSLYINAKLKVFSDYRANPIVVVFCFLPIGLAVLMGGAISADMSHHWYDIIGGAVLGSLIALLTYKSYYVSVFDPRFNHLGLERSRRWVRKPEHEYNDSYDSTFGFPIFRSRKYG